VHRTVRTALGEAVRRRQVQENVATLAKAPKIEAKDLEPYAVAEVRRILNAARERRNAARWAIALSLGLRQGEVLGLHWSDVVHSPCTNQGGRRPHQVPCRQAKDRTAAPARPAPRRSPPRTRSRAGQGWSALGGDGPSLHRPVRRAVKPNSDYHAWKSLLKRAGVRETRLHDARHTAATVLLALGVPERTVMGVMGWSSTSMAARYQHVTDPIRHEDASRVGGLLWSRPESN
jgi:integrase